MKRENLSTEQLLHQWSNLVLPYLPSRDLASAACACRTLCLVAASVTSRRTADASRAFERDPIPFINTTGSPHPYSYFLYTRRPIVSPLPPSFSQSWGGEASKGTVTDCERLRYLPDMSSCFGGFEVGCDCDGCEGGRCPCWSDMELGVLKECGESCTCGLTCDNRKTQSGIRVGLKIVRDDRKGWGLHVTEAIERGDFVCEYAGEYLTTEEARSRLKAYDELSSEGRISPALLVVREHLPSGKACLRINIDATKIGNVARFINHSCDGGNLKAVLVRNSGMLLPRLCFFASMNISEGDELSFSYGESRIKENGLPCFCGSADCLGILPSEET